MKAERRPFRRTSRVGSAVLAALIGAACVHPHPVAGPPPIPRRTGPLTIDVVYPPQGARIAVRDSNFIFGSVGDGRAQLTIDGQDVPVRPNGTFLAWLPVPAGPMDSVAVYELVARLGDDSAQDRHEVRLPTTASVLPEGAWVDSASVQPRGVWWVRPGERVPVSVRARSDAEVRLRLPDGRLVPLQQVSASDPGSAARWAFGAKPPAGAAGRAGSGLFRGSFAASMPLGRGRRTGAPPPVTPFDPVADSVCLHPPADSIQTAAAMAAPCAVIEVVAPRTGEAVTISPDTAASYADGAVGLSPADTVRVPLPLDLWIVEGPGPIAAVRESPSAVGRDGLVVGRPEPGATYAWLWSDGVRAHASGRRNDEVRLALDDRTDAWVSFDDLAWPDVDPEDEAEPARVGTVRLHDGAGRLVVRLAIARPVPYRVAIDGRRLVLTLYGAYSDTDWLRYGPAPAYVRRAAWSQPASDRYELQLELTATPWGYRVSYRSGALVLEIRQPPAIDPEHPLAGRTIVLDPGHPPAGATGPSRLYEGDANLAIAFRARRLLEAAGATVFLARADRGPVRLYDRPALARRLNADVLVSIHNNALPDGVNPFQNHGTSVYYFQDQEADLARALQRSLLETLGLPDLGFGRGNLALTRPTWMPSALTEGAFLMIPEEEAGLRNPAFQEAYARGVVTGIRAFLRGRALEAARGGSGPDDAPTPLQP